MKEVTIYTDGCCIGNPGESAAGIVLVYGEHQREIGKYLGQGTNNTAELLAVIHALDTLKEPCSVDIYSDSQLVVKVGSGDWKANSNLDLWQEYWQLAEQHEVRLHWIRKDSHKLNRRAHDLANEAVLQQTV